MDLGSGAGFPGLIIAALCPGAEVKLIESRNLRIDWLERMITEMSLGNCSVIGSRLEQVPAFPAAVITARAFAPLDRLLRLAARFSTTDTVWLLPKGRSAAQELSELPARQRNLFHVEQSITSPDSGIIVGRLSEGAKVKA